MIERAAASFLLCATLASCAPAPPPLQPLGQTARCIPSDQIVSRRVGGAGALDFELLGGAVYRNNLASACPGMERLGDLAVVAVTSGGEGSRLCRGDRVKVFDPVEAQATGLQSYPECLLGDFTLVAAR
jgi:hypothetical protein